EVEPISVLRERIMQIGTQKGLTLRVWARDEHERPPRIAICTTYRSEPAEAVLKAIEAGEINATPAVIIGNRDRCQSLADRYQLDFHHIGDERGNP
ncbi:MAG TPA: formyltetrahydrofolate deformylase, partial [Planctomycetaceae bacterium]|nr:formyltetrahydrofolate deformylase [Planctomycetaceae bacterium]